MCFRMQAGKTALMKTENAEVADTLGCSTHSPGNVRKSKQ